MLRTGKEKARPCHVCKTALFLAKEGYRCLKCPYVFCRDCAPGHFSSKNAKFEAMAVLKSMIQALSRPQFLDLIGKRMSAQRRTKGQIGEA